MSDILKADVYFNLHSKVWSVKNRKTGHVEAHESVVVFAYPVQFTVSAAGRARVLEEKRKNVHAFVRGTYPGLYGSDLKGWRKAVDQMGEKLVPVSYNPYKGATFYRKDTSAPINEADSVVMIAEPGKPPAVYAVNPRWVED